MNGVYEALTIFTILLDGKVRNDVVVHKHYKAKVVIKTEILLLDSGQAVVLPRPEEQIFITDEIAYRAHLIGLQEMPHLCNRLRLNYTITIEKCDT